MYFQMILYSPVETIGMSLSFYLGDWDKEYKVVRNVKNSKRLAISGPLVAC